MANNGASYYTRPKNARKISDWKRKKREKALREQQQGGGPGSHSVQLAKQRSTDDDVDEQQALRPAPLEYGQVEEEYINMSPSHSVASPESIPITVENVEQPAVMLTETKDVNFTDSIVWVPRQQSATAGSEMAPDIIRQSSASVAEVDDLDAVQADDTRIVYGWVEDFEKKNTDMALAELEDPDEPLKRWLTEQVKLDRQRSKKKREKAALRQRRQSDGDSDEEFTLRGDGVKAPVLEDGKPRSKSTFRRRTERGDVWRRSACFRGMATVVTHNVTTAIMLVLTFWALFGTDLQLAIMPEEWDLTMAAIMLTIMIAFTFELIALSLIQPTDYFLTFFFWMDLIATLSLIPEVLPVFGVETSTVGYLTLARAGRAARAAARTARFARVLKIFEACKKRAIRRKKTAKQLEWIDADHLDDERAGKSVDADHHQQSLTQRNLLGVLNDSLREKSVVGEKAETRLFQHIFFVMLLTFLSLTLLDPTQFDQTEEHAQAALLQLHAGYENNTAALNTYTTSYPDLISVDLDGTRVYQSSVTEDDRRFTEIFEVKVDCGTQGCKSVHDVRDTARLAAWFGIAETLVVILILVGVSGLAFRDMRYLLVAPVERMVATIKGIALNPLITLKIKNDFRYETGLLETMLTKLGVLVQMGFGAPGTQIIKQNLSSSGSLVPLVKGQKIEGIFVIASIRHFTRITEVLQEDITKFCNKVAHVVHSVAAENGGFPWDNTGMTWSLLFPMPPKLQRYSEKEYARLLANASGNCMQALGAIRAQLEESPFLNKMLLRVPESSFVDMQFGAHAGWAIGGAVGSPLKVDCMYLSYHVQLASQLMNLTDEYGVDILLSENLRKMLPDDFKDELMVVDRVCIQGSEEPVTVYAADGIPFDVTAEDIEGFFNEELPAEAKARQGFLQAYTTAIEAYIVGEWTSAKEALEQAFTLVPEHRPCRLVHVLYEWMQAQQWQAPAGWDGYRSIKQIA